MPLNHCQTQDTLEEQDWWGEEDRGKVVEDKPEMWGADPPGE